MKDSVFSKMTFTQIIQKYIESPRLIWHDLYKNYYIFRYHILNLIDPPPKIKRRELTDDYFDRIHPRFGLRFYDCMLHIGNCCDILDATNFINENYTREKDRKLLKKLVIAINKINQDNTEKYRRYLYRRQALKNS